MRHREIRPEAPHPRLVHEMRDRRHITVAHQHLSQVVDTVVRMDGDGGGSAGVRRGGVVHAMAQVVEAVQLVEDFDLYDGVFGGP